MRPPPPLAKPRVEAGPRPSRKMKSFFWDKLPDNRVAGTFWAANPPAYSSLNTQEVMHSPFTLIFAASICQQPYRGSKGSLLPSGSMSIASLSSLIEACKEARSFHWRLHLRTSCVAHSCECKHLVDDSVAHPKDANFMWRAV